MAVNRHAMYGLRSTTIPNVTIGLCLGCGLPFFSSNIFPTDSSTCKHSLAIFSQKQLWFRTSSNLFCRLSQAHELHQVPQTKSIDLEPGTMATAARLQAEEFASCRKFKKPHSEGKRWEENKLLCRATDREQYHQEHPMAGCWVAEVAKEMAMWG